MPRRKKHKGAEKAPSRKGGRMFGQWHKAKEPEPKVDQAKVDAAIQEAQKLLTKHIIGTEGLDFKTLTTYVMDGNGVWEVKQVPAGVVCQKATKVMGLPEQLREGFVMTLPKLPWEFLRQGVAWFREVQAKFKTEAYFQVWWDPTKETYYIVVPVQDVSGGMVHHDGDWDKDGELGHVHVLDLHSHHTMGAFFSSTDDKDEQRYDRLYGVIGEITKALPAWKWRVRSSGKFVDLKLDDLWDMPTGEVTLKVDVASVLKAGTCTLTADLFQGATFPQEWMEKLITERKVVKVTRWNGHGWGDGDAHEPTGPAYSKVIPVGSYGEIHRPGAACCNCFACCTHRKAEFQTELAKDTDLQERVKAQANNGRTGNIYLPRNGRVVRLSLISGEIEDIGIASSAFTGRAN